MQTCKNCQSAISDDARACPYCGEQVQKPDDARRRLWLRMRAGTLASPAAATASAGAFATYVIASTLILAYVILGVFLRPPAALHASPPVLIVTPASLDFGRVEVGRKVVLTEMIKTNSGSQLQWKAVSGNTQWLNVMLSNAIKEPDNFREVIYDVTANTSNLRDGQYSVIFTISADGAKDQQVLIKIQVISRPSPAKLNVNPLLLDFGTQNMGSQGMQFLSVSNKGQADLNWLADWGNTTWLTLNPDQGKIASGGLSEIIQVKVDTATLTAGQHSASINFTSNGGNASVNVVLVVAVGSTPTLVSGPIVSSISPNSGPPEGGTTVTIVGSGFMGSTEVLFGSTAVSNFTINSDTQISAVSPAGSGLVDVTVLTPNGTSATSRADQFTYICSPGSDSSTPPTVTNINPSNGPGAGGTSVIITGTCFYSGTYSVYTVSFGLTQINNFTIDSDTQITAVSPAGSGTVDVTVTTPGGTSAHDAADQFGYCPPIK